MDLDAKELRNLAADLKGISVSPDEELNKRALLVTTGSETEAQDLFGRYNLRPLVYLGDAKAIHQWFGAPIDLTDDSPAQLCMKVCLWKAEQIEESYLDVAWQKRLWLLEQMSTLEESLFELQEKIEELSRPLDSLDDTIVRDINPVNNITERYTLKQLRAISTANAQRRDINRLKGEQAILRSKQNDLSAEATAIWIDAVHKVHGEDITMDWIVAGEDLNCALNLNTGARVVFRGGIFIDPTVVLQAAWERSRRIRAEGTALVNKALRQTAGSGSLDDIDGWIDIQNFKAAPDEFILLCEGYKRRHVGEKLWIDTLSKLQEEFYEDPPENPITNDTDNTSSKPKERPFILSGEGPTLSSQSSTILSWKATRLIYGIDS